MSPRKHEQCFRFDAGPSDIQKCVKEGHRVFVLLRGVTGSGKTTLAQKLIEVSDNSAILSTDVVISHQVTKTVRQSFADDKHLVIVDSENVERSTIRKLAELAIAESYECFVIEPETPWKHDANGCKLKSTRNEDIELIERKIQEIRTSPISWEHLVNGGEINVNILNFHSEDVPADSIPSCFTPDCQSTVNTMSSNSSTTSLAQVFSMAPEPKMKTMKSVSTHVTVESIAYGLAGIHDEFDRTGYFFEEEKTIPDIWKSKVRMIERKTETEEVSIGPNGENIFKPFSPLVAGTSEEIQFSMLRSVFQQVELVELHHYLQVYGYEDTFHLLKMLGEASSTRAMPVDDRILWEELEAMESFTVSNMSVEEEMEARRIERFALKFVEDFYDLEETENDEQIARLLDAEINGENNKNEDADHYNVAHLQQVFPNADFDVVSQMYELLGKNIEAAREVLLDMGHEEDSYARRFTPKPTWSKTVAASSSSTRRVAPKKTKQEENNHFLKAKSARSQLHLPDVQRLAISARQKIETDRLAGSSYNSSSSPRFRQYVMMDRVTRMKAGKCAEVKEIDSKIREAHSNPWNLDLHYMSVDGALKLVTEAMEAVRYHMKSSNKVNRWIMVVTGSGNNSRYGARIKPQVLSMLERLKISYEMINDGCIKLKL